MADGRSRALRQAGEESPDTTGRHAPRKRGSQEPKFFATESVTENTPPRASEARVKRRGKSPPPQAQARGHEKPHAVQDRTGGMGRLARPQGRLQVLVAAPSGATPRAQAQRGQINGRPFGPRVRGDKIRLTAIVRPCAAPATGAAPEPASVVAPPQRTSRSMPTGQWSLPRMCGQMKASFRRDRSDGERHT